MSASAKPAAAARRETAAPNVRRRPSPPAPADSLRDLPIRLTHRSVLVLRAIGFRPGSSNRDVGRAAGIEDQGQTSKLLKRLGRVGLILNTRDRSLRGAPNAWVLTDDGEAMLRVVAGPGESEPDPKGTSTQKGTSGSRATSNGR